MADQVALPEDQEFFKLNEVCKTANVQPYMLRFWGTEFAQLEAAKSGTGQRLYSRDQVVVILEIRRLLFDEGLTIAGARKRINAMQEEGTIPTPDVPTIPDEVPKKPKPPAKAPKPARHVKRSKPAEMPEEEPAVEEAKDAKPPPAAAKPTKAEVDKAAAERVKPLLATLKDVRKEVAKIVAQLKPES
jgi:DNA-binding transcriptional MerR regulator